MLHRIISQRRLVAGVACRCHQQRTLTATTASHRSTVRETVAFNSSVDNAASHFTTHSRAFSSAALARASHSTSSISSNSSNNNNISSNGSAALTTTPTTISSVAHVHHLQQQRRAFAKGKNKTKNKNKDDGGGKKGKKGNKGGGGNNSAATDAGAGGDVEFDVASFTPQMDECLTKLTDTYAGLHAGRVTSSLIADIPVRAYETTQPLQSLATVSVRSAHELHVVVHDVSIVAGVEEALRTHIEAADSGASVATVRDGLLVKFPKPTAESREALAKQARAELETTKQQIRLVRRAAVDALKKADPPKDDKFQYSADIDALTKKMEEKASKLYTEKEKAIKTI